MKKLYVCGDSWASASPSTPGKHYSELLANDLGYELISMARGGMSNGGIALQIEYAIKHKADLVVISTTTPDRMEFPIDGESFSANNGIIEVSHTKLRHSCSISSNNLFLIKPTLMSENLVSIFNGRANNSDITANQLAALRQFFSCLYDEEWKKQQDIWILKAVLYDILAAKIPFIMCNDQLGLSYRGVNIDQKHFSNIDSYVDIEPNNDPGYHTSISQQYEIYSKLKESIERL